MTEKKLHIEIFVQARMGSTRLPGKTLKQVNGKPLLHYLWERLQRVSQAQRAMVLTTALPEDDALAFFCDSNNIPYYRGPDEDVLARFHQAALKQLPDAIVRVTADCPLIDPKIIDDVIQVYRNGYPQWDYVSNVLERTFPRGMDIEVFSRKALDQAFLEATSKSEREHVTLHLYRHPENYRLRNVANIDADADINLSQCRLTVDTPEDFALIRLIIEHLYPINPQFNLQDILDLLRRHPDWLQINSAVRQKHWGQV